MSWKKQACHISENDCFLISFYVLEAFEHVFGESERLFELVERLFVLGDRCALPTLLKFH